MSRLDKQWHSAVIVKLMGRIIGYHPRILHGLGSLVGRTIKIDLKTRIAEQGRFAKIGIEVYLMKPLEGRVEFNDNLDKVSYEGLPKVRYTCGCVGHPMNVRHLVPRKMGTSNPSPRCLRLHRLLLHLLLQRLTRDRLWLDECSRFAQ
ncbi:hypothetical protein Tsubulata_009092 [Turnera subulata]|uniref:DUF4283 domain-containing protein n=1 Tax=Turnera subulata TaxID=218843 RepID=A0A9Q0EXW5_9ROSI|nr:hypothetical protein Tsubulata_009092 [Turnera subulata]